MRSEMAEDVFGPILDHVRAEPSRTWSIILTAYGDAIVPRGGCVWLGTLLSIFRGMDIADGVVRTAMSRLAGDGWLTRSKVGRNSFYSLAEKGRETFRRAEEHIYNPRPPVWEGYFDMALMDNGTAREAIRPVMREAGFGSPLPNVWIAPPGGEWPAVAMDAVRLRTTGDAQANRELAARSWALDEAADLYQRFCEAFAPLRQALSGGLKPGDLEALVARILLIHEYRRIVLRAPSLPAEVLPPQWPGAEARALCADVYGLLLPASERWLDKNAIGEDGAPLKAGRDIRRRFKNGGVSREGPA